MWNATVIFLTYLFAAYGFACFIMMLVQSYNFFFKPVKDPVKLVLVVRNKEEDIEGIVRTVIKGDVLKKAMTDGELVILDAGSNDGTLDILSKLKKDYEFINIVPVEEKERIFNIFS